jgi:hypothetical protein
VKTHFIQSSFLSGVLSPEASARVESEAYNQGLLTGINVVPRPLGGMRRRPGLAYVDTLPNVLSRKTGMTITATNGGTTANANDGSTATSLVTTTDVGTTNPFVVVHYDLGAADSILFADVLGLSSTGGSSTEFRIQYSTDNAAWTTLGDAFELVDSTARSYRRGGTPVSARYWRVAKVGGTDMGAVDTALTEFNLWTETSTVSAVRLVQFEVDTETQYLCAFTDRSLAVYEDGVLVVHLPSPYTSADIADIDAAQNQDSLVLTHSSHPPRFVFPELGTLYSEPIAFTYVPQYDFDDASSPTPTSAVQVITFAAGWKQGETFQIDLEGARTTAVTYGGDATAAEQATTASNIAREIQKLYTVPGFSGVSCARTNTREYTVTFAGQSAKDYDLLSGVPLTGTNDIVVTETTAGTPRTEDAWSATRGYPRTVTFFEGRMYFGGTPSLPTALMASKVNQILDFEVGEALDDDGLFVVLSGQQLNALQGMYAGRSLQLFTSAGELRFAKDQGAPVTPGDAPSAQTQYGSARIRPVATDGTTIFVQRTRKAIRDFRYDYEEDAYNSLGLSALAPHLINDVRDLAAWNGSSTDEINLVYAVNGDGTLAVLTSRREANVRAWVQWTTQGLFKAAAGMLENSYFAVQRSIDGVDTLFLEQTDPDSYLDCSIRGATTGTVNVANVRYVYQSPTFGYYRYVDTATPHGLEAGDSTTIEGIVASDSYDVNGTWVVLEVVSTTTVRLKSTFSAPTGAYVSGGTMSTEAANTVTGLAHLNGEECRVRADGFVLENVTPAAGSATLAEGDFSYAEVGLGFAITLTPMPLNQMLPEGANLMRKRRVTKVRARVYETLGLRINGRALPDTAMDIDSFDAPAEPFSGIRALEETTNWDEEQDKLVEFSQVDPLPFTLLGIDIALEGNE